MKILSYNIFNGAHDRTDSVLAVIRESGAEIVGLCECNGFERSDRRAQFEHALDMQSVVNNAPSGAHVALFYRNGLSIKSTRVGGPMMYHGFSSIVVDLPGIGRTAIVMTHLNPLSSVFRLGEAQQILCRATFEQSAIIMGDFNAIAPSDAPSSLKDRTINAQIRLAEPNGSPASAAIAAILDHGMIDLGALQKEPTFPTRLGMELDSGDPLRLDYVFTTPNISRIARLTTITTDAAEVASDHLPLVCQVN